LTYQVHGIKEQAAAESAKAHAHARARGRAIIKLDASPSLIGINAPAELRVTGNYPTNDRAVIDKAPIARGAAPCGDFD